DRESATPPTARAQFWILQAVGWSAFVGALMQPRRGAIPLSRMLMANAPLVITGVAATLLLRALYRALTRRAAPGWVVAATVAAYSYLLALAWSTSADWASRSLLHGSEHASLIQLSLIRLSFDRFSGVLYCTIVLIAWSVLYFGITHHRELVAQRERSLRAESLAREARLDALRYQVNPHFLFNTLNAISTLVVERRTTEATGMIAQLGGFLRHTLDGADDAEIPLEEELRFARQYLEIERMRFGDRLAVTIEAAPEVRSLRVPAFILLPVVENAIRHAVERNERGGRIAILARRLADVLELTVLDDGPGVRGSPAAGSGIGLSNTRARLANLYGSRSSLRWNLRDNGGSQFVLEIPLHGSATPRRTLAHA
ncbi:MAG: sensor histidine kinase, partial [Gemmatimonadales bacterium]